MSLTRVHVIVKGRVQGVCFRAETQYEARKLGLSGWVRNLRDGSVEAVFEGEKSDVERMIQWCGRGPISAMVKDLFVEHENYTGEFDGFSVTF